MFVVIEEVCQNCHITDGVFSQSNPNAARTSPMHVSYVVTYICVFTKSG